eukprot:Lankesteria_metandrocarpae@DN2297_c0_g1_i1.p1
MDVIVRGLDSTSRVVVLHPGNTVADAKSIYASIEGIPLDGLRLSCGLQCLSDDLTLQALGITEESTVCASYELLGGAKKRKKKQYSTPKKGKHKKKKVKLAVLKFYKVGGDGSITKLRKDCPSPSCGAGTFMATHPDRCTCGRCGAMWRADKAGK